MNVLVTICGRGGSKGLPGKNIRPLAGLPLIAYSIRQAQRFLQTHTGILALSSDCPEIRDVAAQYGLASDYVRPAELASDQAGKVPVIAHLLQHEESRRGQAFDWVLDLDITSPMRTVADLEAAYQLMLQHPQALTLLSGSPPHRNPYFNMVELQPDSPYCRLVKSLPQGVVLSRQNAPQVWDINASFYYYRRSFFEQVRPSVLTERTLVFEVPHLCFDVDSPMDFEFMSYLLEQQRLDFEV